MLRRRCGLTVKRDWHLRKCLYTLRVFPLSHPPEPMNSRQAEMAEMIRNNPRKMGGFLLFVGGLALYQAVLKPMQDAAKEVHSISISQNMTMLSVLFVTLGLALLIGGGRIARITHPAPGESRVGPIILAIVVLGIGIAGYAVLKSYMTSHGYEFQSLVGHG